MVPGDDANDRTVQPGVAGRRVADVADAKGPSEGQSSAEVGNVDVTELVRQTTVSVLTERIRLLGIDRSGAYEHYNMQLALGFPIGPGERAIFKFVRDRIPNLRSYHEIGSGLGTLPFMLAVDGFASVGIDRDERRHLTALAILRELAQVAPQTESNCRLIGGACPDAVSDLDVSDSMAILTDFISTQSPRDYARLGHGLAHYRYVVMDLQRFCAKRESAAEQDELVQELSKCGLVVREEIVDLGSQGRYVLFESTVAGERRPLPGDKPVPTQAVAAAAVSVTDVRSNKPTGVSVALAAGELEARKSQSLVEAETTADAPVPLRATTLPPMPRRTKPGRFGGWLGLSALLVIGLPAVLAIAYYGFWASKQYVTSMQFAVRGPSQATMGRSGGGMQGSGAMTPDSFVVADYINSSQAIIDVKRRLDLKEIFSKPDVDFWARLPEQVAAEDLAKYWHRMVSASFDLISGNITVTVRAFSPAEALKLADALVTVSDEMFRKLNAQIQQDYVRVADGNVAQAQKQLISTTQAVLEFRDKSGLVDPGKTADAGASIIDDLRKQLAGFQAQYTSLRATAANSPALTTLKSQIATLEEQIRRESRLGSSQVKSVTADTLAKYQTLEIERQTAEKLYGEAVSMRTQAYIMAQSQQSYLGLFAAPSLPEASLYPDRPRAIATVILSAALAWFIGMLVVYAMRDHLM